MSDIRLIGSLEETLISGILPRQFRVMAEQLFI